MPFYTENKTCQRKTSFWEITRKQGESRYLSIPEDKEILETMMKKGQNNAGDRIEEFFVNVIKT